jgi:hypothetical protein
MSTTYFMWSGLHLMNLTFICIFYMKNTETVSVVVVKGSTTNQGWVDYKIFVVRYNYSYFKNM